MVFGGVKLDTLLMAIAYKVQSLSPNSVYQVLIGKRTATTLFFAFSNNLMPMIGLYPKLTKAQWATYHQNASDYISLDAIYRHHQQPEFFKQIFEEILPYRDGLMLAQHHQQQQMSLLLLVQVLSYAKAENNRYIPMVQDLIAQQLIKKYSSLQVKAHGKGRLADLATILHHQLEKDLTSFPDQAVLIFLQQLEGAHLSALTIDQLIEIYGLSKREVVIVQQGMTDQLLNYWLQDESNDEKVNPALKQFAQVISQVLPKWNQSTQETFHMIHQGFTIDQMAHRRYLKRSTITEHLIEISFSQPQVVIPMVLQELNLRDINFLIHQQPDEKYEDFKERFGEKDYWLYRFWKIIYQKGAIR